MKIMKLRDRRGYREILPGVVIYCALGAEGKSGALSENLSSYLHLRSHVSRSREGAPLAPRSTTAPPFWGLSVVLFEEVKMLNFPSAFYPRE